MPGKVRTAEGVKQEKPMRKKVAEKLYLHRDPGFPYTFIILPLDARIEQYDFYIKTEKPA